MINRATQNWPDEAFDHVIGECMSEKAPAWNERDTATVAQEGIARQARTNWRKVTITCDPITGNIVLEYGTPSKTTGGEYVEDVRHYSQQQFHQDAQKIARLIGNHVTP